MCIRDSGIVDSRINHHRVFVWADISDFFIHIEEVAVTLCNDIFTPVSYTHLALMQGLADGYFVLPYTIQNYLADQITVPCG